MSTIHWRSTPNTIKNIEPTILAVVETIFSACIYYYLAVYYFESWTPYLLACSIAPLMLLKNPESVSLGLRIITNTRILKVIGFFEKKVVNFYEMKFYIRICTFLFILAFVYYIALTLSYLETIIGRDFVSRYLISPLLTKTGKAVYLVFFSVILIPCLPDYFLDKVVSYLKKNTPNYLLTRQAYTFLKYAVIYPIAFSFYLVSIVFLYRLFAHYSEKFGALDYLWPLLEASPKLTLIAWLMPFALYIVFVSVIIASSIKFFSTIKTLLFRPLTVLGSIPSNWRAAFSIDMFTKPEIIPGISEIEKKPVGKDLREFQFETVMARFKNSNGSIVDIIIGNVVNISLLLLVFVPAYLYRLSLKGTIFVWFPLLWVATFANDQRSICTRLKLGVRSTWSKITLFVSIIFIFLFCLKIVFLDYLFTIFEVYLSSSAVLLSFFQPEYVPIWQLACLSNSIIFVVFYFWSESRLIEEENEPSSGRTAIVLDVKIRAVLIVRALLSVYSISCLFYLIAVQIDGLNLPEIGTDFFPWSASWPVN